MVFAFKLFVCYLYCYVSLKLCCDVFLELFILFSSLSKTYFLTHFLSVALKRVLELVARVVFTIEIIHIYYFYGFYPLISQCFSRRNYNILGITIYDSVLSINQYCLLKLFYISNCFRERLFCFECAYICFVVAKRMAKV